ncbi:hypothetical protein M0813_20738 [Anaeramoeba flamelloides]|uniref:Uncharacterized protein n=1 Tax=Anaeramoeba flamelloides TaxID=1746091 RepID=A0ABQ8YKE2_9EUKA|nr:hypothetical protein M0813_20738 [Anaeramoeba flamelloides]
METFTPIYLFIIILILNVNNNSFFPAVKCSEGNTFKFKISGNEFPVTNYTYGEQTKESITSLSDMNFLAIWQSAAQDGSGLGIIGRQFDATFRGTPISRGKEFLVKGNTEGNQQAPSTLYLTKELIAIVWESTVLNEQVSGIYLQVYFCRMQETPRKIGHEICLDVPSSETSSKNPYFQRLNSQLAVVAWEKYFIKDNSKSIIEGKLIQITGNGTNLDIFVSFTIEPELKKHNYFRPSIAILEKVNHFVVVWKNEDTSTEPTRTNIKAQLFQYLEKSNARSIISVGQQLSITNLSNRSSDSPSVIPYFNDGFVVIYRKSNSFGSEYEIYANLIYPDFSKGTHNIGKEFRISELQGGISKKSPTVVNINEHIFLALWSQYSPNSKTFQIFGRLYTFKALYEQPTAINEPQIINKENGFDHDYPQASYLDLTKIIILYQSKDQNLHKQGIFGQIYTLTEYTSSKRKNLVNIILRGLFIILALIATIIIIWKKVSKPKDFVKNEDYQEIPLSYNIKNSKRQIEKESLFQDDDVSEWI